MMASLLADSLCAVVRLVTGVQGQWQGCSPISEQRVYFANHTSHLDFLILWSLLPKELRLKTRPVAAADYWSKGRVRRFFSKFIFRALLVERHHVTRSNNPITHLLTALNAGESLIIFPEGGRTTGNEIQNFKSGLFYLSKAMPALNLVPVYINNANRILPKGKMIPLPLLCTVTFGKPLSLAAGESKPLFLQRAHDAIQQLCSL